MAGYYKNKMSNNAVAAYQNGEMPWSKWSKQAILDCLPKDIADIAKKYPLRALRSYFLFYDGYHHTGKYFNSTDFYYIDESIISNFCEEELREHSDAFKAEPKPKSISYLAYCKWGEWTGSRSHPKLVSHEGYCIIKDNWAFSQEHTKKKINGKHFEIVDKFQRAPRGTAHIFKDIKKYFKI